MGAFTKCIIRSGFATVYTPGSVTPTTASKATKQSPAELELGSGTGASNCDIEYLGQRTLGASANETLDLRGGLTDAFGTTLQFVSVKGIWIKASSSNTNSVIFKPAAADSFLIGFGAAAHQFTIPPGGVFMVTYPTTGWAPGAAATDDIYFENSAAGSSVVYDLHIVGSTA